MRTDTILKAIDLLARCEHAIGRDIGNPSEIGSMRADCFAIRLALRQELSADVPTVKAVKLKEPA